MTDGLERILKPGRIHFKSEGERKIGRFLDDNSIRYQYEPPVLVNGPYDKLRIWYIDFNLPEFATYIEFWGLAGNPGYDEGIKTKLSVYKQMNMDVISFYPRMFKEDWQGYIMNELDQITRRRQDCLKAKKCWAQKDNAFGSYEIKGMQGSIFH